MKSSIKKAFTFIEMLGVLCIVVILISISTIAFRHGQGKARDMIRKNDLQMIADALISYANDHGHFPSSIYDNGQALTISQALNSTIDGGAYLSSGLEMSFYFDLENLQDILKTGGISEDIFDFEIVKTGIGLKSKQGEIIYKLKDNIPLSSKSEYDTVSLITKIFENNAATPTNLKTSVNNMYYSIVTQGMCVSSLQKYLINEGYLSTIPQDPSGEAVELQTNICIKGGAMPDNGAVNANDTGWSIQESDCYTNTNFGCTQICKAGYVYISDGEHFALIARMESKNNGNYEVTSCGSCELANQCKSTPGKTGWTSTEQLPCDITDEFTNTFDCIQNTGVVEYSTGQYYFYIY